MKKLKSVLLAVIALQVAFLLTPNKVIAETFKKLHPSVQRVIYLPATTYAGTNANNVAARGTSSTIDLSGGDLDKLSFGVHFDSATAGAVTSGAGILTVRLDISPDGGTTWLTNYTQSFSTQSVTAALTLLNTYYTDIKVNPGTKARLVNTMTTDCTFYGLTEWALPNTD